MDPQPVVHRTSPARKIALELALGAVLGFVGWGLCGPWTIGLLYQPPSGNAFSCAGTVREALGKFVTMQLVCAAVGAVGLAAAFFFVGRARNRAAAPSQNS